MIALRDEGKIGGVGISNVTLDQLQHARPRGLACVQNAYSLLDRSAEPLLDLCREDDIAWVPYFPLGSAFPGMPKVSEHPAVDGGRDRARRHAGTGGTGVAARARAEHPAHPGHVLAEHLAENLATGDVVLDADTMAALDDAWSPQRAGD